MKNSLKLKKIKIIIIITVLMIAFVATSGLLYTIYGDTTLSIGTNVTATFNITSGDLTITSTSGTGTIDKTSFDSYKTNIAKSNVKRVIFTNAVIAPANMSNFFDGFSGMTTISGLAYLNTSNATSFYSMFNECSQLTSLDLTSFNTSKVTSMANMFNGCSSLSSLNISTFDTSKVTTMGYMFKNCSALQSINLSNFNTSSVTIMHSMFMGCKRATTINVSSFNTSNVISMDDMFCECNAVTSLNLNGFDTSKISTFNGMYTGFFENCSSLTSLDLTAFSLTSARQTPLFKGCSSIKTLVLSSFDMTLLPTYSNSIDLSTLTSLTDLYTPKKMDSSCRVYLPDAFKLSSSTTSKTSYIVLKDAYTGSFKITKETGYEITLNLQGGSFGGWPIASKFHIESGYYLPDLSNLYIKKTGYELNGFYTGTNGTGTRYYYGSGMSYISAPNLTSDLTLYANWTSTTLTVTFDANGGTASSSSKSVTKGSTYGSLPTASKDGYTFDGWYTASTGGTKVETSTTVTATANHTLYAHWTAETGKEYTVKHYKMNLDGTTYGTPENETKQGSTDEEITIENLKKTYEGFAYKEGKVDNSVETTTTILGDGSRVIEIYYTRNKYNLTLNKGTGIDTVTGGGNCYYGEEVTINATVSSGYNWKNWTGESTISDQSKKLTMPAKDITYTANAELISYNIIYNFNGGVATGNPSSYNIDTATFTLNNPTKNGYTFTGWTGSNGTTSEMSVSVNKGSTGDKTYTANWTANTYTVNYNGNGNSGGSTAGSSHTYDVAKNLTTNGYTKSYTVTYNLNYSGGTNTTDTSTYTFSGWNTKSDGTGTSYIDSQSVTNLTSDNNGIVNLYAKWTGGNITLSTPTRNGYAFEGWYKEASCTNKAGSAGANYTPTSDITLYANWTTNNNTNYTVKHYQMNLDGMTYTLVSGDTETKTGTTAAIITIGNLKKTYEGFTYKEGKVDNSVETTTTILGDGSRVIEIYYTRNKYNLTLNKGTGIDTVTGGGNCYYGEEVTINATVSSGYNWKNWTGESTIFNQSKKLTMPAKDITYTANAELISYNIIYNFNGGVATGNPSSYNIDTATFTLNNPTKTGYTFTGWTGSNGQAPEISVSITKGSTGDKTFTANWQINSYTVTFKDGSTQDIQNVNYGANAVPPSWSKQGYILSWDKSYSNVTSDITVNAVWTEDTGADTSYKIEYYVQNITKDAYELKDTENLVGQIGSTVTANKTFIGFTENISNPNSLKTGTVLADGSLVLKVYYERNTYNITFNLNGGEIKSGNITDYIYGERKVLPTNVTKDGYNFMGWYDNQDFIGSKIELIGTDDVRLKQTKIMDEVGSKVEEINTSDYGDKTFYAKWEEDITLKEFTVTFKDGSKEETQTVKYGKSATAPKWTKTGYILSWDGSYSNITKDTVVKAVWKVDPNYDDGKKDDTVAPGILPNTGIKIVGTLIGIISILGVTLTYIRIKIYKNLTKF